MLFAAAFANAAAADVEVADQATYVGDLSIVVKGKETKNENTNIIIERTDAEKGLYKLSIKDFKFGDLSLGDINLTDVEGVVDDNRDLRLSVENQSVSVKLSIVPVAVKVSLEGVVSGAKFKTTSLEIMDAPMVGTVSAAFEGESDAYLVAPKDPESPATSLPSVNAADGTVQIFNLLGHPVQTMGRGVYIIRRADGSTVKVVRR